MFIERKTPPILILLAMLLLVLVGSYYGQPPGIGAFAFRSISTTTVVRWERVLRRRLRMSQQEDDDESATAAAETASNVLGTTLSCCCSDVRGSGIGTGFYRNGYCSTGEQDLGRHTVCVQVTDDFLQSSASAGNDLSTPIPQFTFPGLKEGDIWCLCAQRWVQAYEAGKAPKLFLQATHEKTLTYVPFEVLREYAIDAEQADKTLGDLNEQRAKLNKLLE